jgi:putative CocE/NonD family hydrolase
MSDTARASCIEFDVAVERDVRIPMRDGATLATDVYRPMLGGHAVDGRFPTILERTPYSRARTDLELMGKYFATRGYVVALQDCRGRYDSDGDFTFFLHSHEATDGYDTVEWLADRPWSNGRIGTTGLSYAGANQQALAVLRPPHLTTQIVLDAGFNYWRRTLRNAGAFHEGHILPYVFWMALASREARQDSSVRAGLRQALADIELWMKRVPLKRGASPLALVPGYEDWYLDLTTRADYDAVWRDPMPSFEAHIDEYPDIPVCFVASWYGLHTWASFEKFNALRARNSQPVRVVVGTWLHAFNYMEQTWSGEVDFGNDAAESLNDFRLRWFDRWLKGVDNREESRAPVRLFVMGGGSGRRNLAGRMEHGGTWRDESDWPLARTRFVDLYLHARGTLSETPPEGEDDGTSYTYDPGDPVPTIGGHVMDPLGGEKRIIYGGAFDQRGRRDLMMCADTLPIASRPDVEVFRSDPLSEATEVTGPISAHLWVSSSAPDTDFVVRLVDEHPPNEDYPEGFAMNLCDTIVRMRYRNERETAELIEPGRVYELAVDLLPTSNVFGERHRIRLDITSSSSPQYDRNPNTGGRLGESHGHVVARNTIYHDETRPSCLRLPVVANPPGPTVER